MSNPYRDLPSTSFWKTAVAEVNAESVFPIPAKRFLITPGARVATAGSCFAQEVGKYPAKMEGIELLVAESAEADQPLFSALYGNVYTVEQLVQLFDRAFGLYLPADNAWQRSDGRYVDPFRPYVFPSGFASTVEVENARKSHLEAVRNVFSECSIFVFTLGLTEAWRQKKDGAVLPVAPGVVTEKISPSKYEFHNFSYGEVLAGLRKFIGKFHGLNPSARIVLTVSPVPLIATYTAEHVLVATTYSKSVLRAVCSEVESEYDFAHYFPSYEIISGAFTRGRYYNSNLRTIAKEGVDHVMETFRRTYLDRTGPSNAISKQSSASSSQDLESDQYSEPPICDEEEIVRSLGF